jgi:replication factor C small subunit
MVQELLTEKLRPKKIEHMILPKRISNVFSQGIQQNVLLSGSPGCGKTSMAKILMKDHPHLFINVSDESSVDTVRSKITDFCSTVSIMDGKNAIKIVVLDEFDGASDQFYKALRGTIEKFAKGTRFIATCNYLNKLPDPIKSRFEVFDFDPIDKAEEKEIREEWIKRIELILGKTNIKISDKALSDFAGKYFPDMRSALNTIQRWMIEGTNEITEKKVHENFWGFEELYLMLIENKDPVKNYQLIVGQYSGRVDDVMNSLASDFILWIKENKPNLIQFIPQILILTAKYQAERNLVIDPCVSLLGLFFSIQKLLP